MPPVMFEQVDAEITDERQRTPEPTQAKPANSTELADQVRRELALIESRRSRLVVD
jgi:hypothetical protein